MKGIFARALETKQRLTIMYIDRNEQITQRMVKVLRLNDEHLVVYCFYRRKIRTLKFSHVLSAEPTRTKMGA